ncbi:GNAT family N-acetyltransferase [Streptomyces thermolineatus]|uniref:GNAT family N-acetyltransferase n=1 Tax=Streptomyces thermolineatus TaxID=44033 RepID=A0ABN3LU68_9ACTN|nr:N-acetyltransferase [Streptomyces sp. HB2AG]MCZ2524502.1 N-acetyltransferase [Streptomyces sp. HB2AG]
MNDEVIIRPARAEDDRELAELDRRCWSWLHAVLPPSPEGSPFFRNPGDHEDFLVAEADGRPAGYLKLVPPTPLECNRHVLQIQGLAVDTAVRGRGVGRALLDAAARRARERGAVRLTLRVLGHNAPARRLYEAAGFSVEGVLPGEFLLDGKYVDDVLMGRRLDGDG